jgi:hypothetical protein
MAIALLWIWKYWKPSHQDEIRLSRVVAGVVTGILLMCAIFQMKKDHHYACTEEVRSRDEIECIGEYVRVKGPEADKVLPCYIALLLRR